ncbi:unnamed protein product [Sphagnum balticum]
MDRYSRAIVSQLLPSLRTGAYRSGLWEENRDLVPMGRRGDGNTDWEKKIEICDNLGWEFVRLFKEENKDLQRRQRALLSDHEILMGVFHTKTLTKTRQAILDAGIEGCEMELIRNELKLHNIVKTLQRGESPTTALNSKFKELEDCFDDTLATLTTLRETLECIRKGRARYCHYKFNVLYKLIGNQILPEGVILGEKTKKRNKVNPNGNFYEGRRFE